MSNMAGWIVSAILGLASLAGWTHPCPQAEEFETYRLGAHTQLVQRLETHAGWCRSKKIHVEYGKTLKLILEFDSQNTAALKGLGFERRGMEWVAPKKEKSFKNCGEKFLEEVPEHYREAIAPLIEGHTRWVEAGELSVEERRVALADILRLAADNALVVGAGVEIRAAAASILPETLVARERRVQLKKWVDGAFASAPETRTGELKDRDRALGVDWLGVVEAPTKRVVYATDRGEAERLLLALHAAESVFQSLFPGRRGLPRDLSVYLMETELQKTPFLANHPAVNDEYRAFLQNLGGSGIQGSRDFAFWSGDAQRRADGIVRIALGWMFQGGFGFSVESGWAYEGFGLYLTRLIVRTRLTWTAQAESDLISERDFKLPSRLLPEYANWMEQALRLWNAERVPDFGELMRKNVNQLSAEDVLVSYALAAYLLEGQPEKIDRLLRVTGSAMPLEEQVERAFSWDLETFRDRAGRWLSERR
jgi:hypothetical protein